MPHSNPEKLIDHLFRHQFGKMVSILTKYFGFEHLETIEDAVQDTFIQAIKTWSNEMPHNPEGWLTAAAKNRVIDIFRSIQSEKQRTEKYFDKPSSEEIDQLFLEHEIEDSQLRMIFTACHPSLKPKEQIAFALRTISGFSIKEVAMALLSTEETIKKRLQRARKLIAHEQLDFEIPMGSDLPHRLDRVLEVLYVIFNEGFHSNKKDMVIRKDLCGEALRLSKMILKKKELRLPKMYALFALMCFHSARLDSKVNAENELINLSKQDRSSWYFPLIALGNEAMNEAVNRTEVFSSYHYEAAIASEHLRAPNFELTNWKIISEWYEELLAIQPHVQTQLNLAIVYLQLDEIEKSNRIIQNITTSELAHNLYLYYGTLAELYHKKGDIKNAVFNIDLAIQHAPNSSEKRYLAEKKTTYQ